MGSSSSAFVWTRRVQPVCARSSSSFSDGFMNAWNFGWKLALVANGTAPAALLGTYQAERQTVGRNVLWLTTGPSPSPPRPARLGRFVRTRVAPLLAQFAARFPAGRAAGFRTLSQLAIGYTTAPQSSTAAPSGGRAGRRRAT